LKKPVVLRIFKGDDLQAVKQYTDAQIVIGQPGDVQVPLDGDKISVIHAAIEERGGSYYVCDLGSETGTMKNGVTVLDSKLEPGDIIQVGEFRLEFFVGVPKPKLPSGGSEAPRSPSEMADNLKKPTGPPASAPVVKRETPASVSTQSSTTAIPAPAPLAAVPTASVVPPKAPTPLPHPPSSATSSIEMNTNSGVSQFSLAGPRAARPQPVRRAGMSEKLKKKKERNTFAPASKHKSVRDFVKPSKGTVVEVLVAWRERVIATYHFSGQRVVTMGSKPDCDVVLPVFNSRARKVPFLKLTTSASVLVTPEMTGELIRGQSTMTFNELLKQNRLMREGAVYSLALEQGEMMRVDLNDQVALIVRYVSDSPKPLVAPILDLTTAEFVGIVLSGAIVATLWLFTILYTPPKGLPGDDLADEPLRTAIVIVPPTPRPLAVRVEATPAATPPPVVVHATPAPTKAAEVHAAQQKTQSVTNLTTKQDNGLSANAAPNKNVKAPRQVTSPKQGGSVKTTDKPASQMQSRSKDVSKSGVFSVFGTGGANNELAQHTTGAGELAGLANAATGKSGYDQNRAGQGLGADTKDTGQGGTGKALTGIAGGVSTNGRGSGNAGYGTGGLGKHAGTKIVSGGSEELIPGTIDRNAILRVIKANERVIKACYERQLNSHPDLNGKLVIGWSIGEQGHVVATSTKSNDLGNREVAECIMSHLKTWTFPEPPAGQVVDVAYPWVFSN
jgi:hypothetical protein